MNEIFVSYSRHDEAFVHRLIDDLEQAGVDVWWDRTDIPGGANWQVEIDKALESCSIMLFVLSPNSMASEHAQRELNYFFEHEKTVIPILWETAEVGIKLSQLQYVDFEIQNHKVALKQLYQALARLGIAVSQSALDSALDWELPQQRLPLVLSDMLSKAKEEVWASGITLEKMASRHLERIQERMQDGVKFRFLVQALDEDSLRQSASWLGCDELGLTFRLLQGMNTLQTACETCQPDAFQIRTVNMRPGFGYVIVDPNSAAGVMTAAPYLYHLDVVKQKNPRLYDYPPLFYLTRNSVRKNEQDWFERFKAEYEQLWADGQPWKLRSKA